MVQFKLDNRKITRALEQTSERTSFLESPNYRLAHALFTDLLTDIVTPDRAAWTAHALLSFTRIDLLENLITPDIRSYRSRMSPSLGCPEVRERWRRPLPVRTLALGHQPVT
jgi:hypothetical protein